MGCNGCNSSNVPNGCKNNGYCLTQRCNQKTTLDLIANINNSSKKKNNRVKIYNFYIFIFFLK